MKTGKKILFIFIVAMVFTALLWFGAAAEPAGGTCGDNLTWTLDESGVLTISGEGPMTGHPWENGNVRTVIIDDGVTGICDDAFFSCYSLTDVTISDTVISIGDRAFSHCFSLTGVTMPDDLISIGQSAFENCYSLREAPIPDSVISIGQSAFANCSFLTSVTIPDGVTGIDDGVFRNCSSLKNVQIPDSVNSIGAAAFSSCSGLTDILIPESVTGIGEAAFQYCSSLKFIKIPENVASIGNYAFSGSGLKSITIPDGITGIGKSVFSSCSSMTDATIPGSVTSIGDQAFNACDKLKDVYYTGTEEQWNLVSIGSDNNCLDSAVIHFNATGGTCGGNLTWILEDQGVLMISGSGDMADYSLTAENGAETADTPWYSLRARITSVILSNGVTGIGDYAFFDCRNLTRVTLPGSITGIGACAFRGCSSLAAADYLGSEAKWSAVRIGSGNECLTDAAVQCMIILESDHPCGDDTVKTWTYTYPGEAAYLKITFSNETETPVNGEYISLTDEAGNTCYYTGAELAGEDIYLPGRSFSIRLRSYSTYSVYGFAITGVAGLSEAEYEEYSSTLLGSGSCGDSLTWELTCGGGLTVSGTGEMMDFGQGETEDPWFHFRNRIKTVQIETGAASIGRMAFNECRHLLHVEIPDSVVSIGVGAFYRAGLKNLTIPDSVTSIGGGAFSRAALENVVIPYGVTRIEDETFHFGSLKSVVIPDSVTSIGYMAFRYNFSLTSITLPDSLTSIERFAFEDCRFTSVTIPGNVVSMGSAFHNCYELKDAVISEGVASISEAAFSGCSSLESVTIPETVTGIQSYAFSGCTSLADVYYAGTETQWNEILVDGGNEYLTGARIHFNATGPEIEIIADGACGEDLAWTLDGNGVLTISGTGGMTDFTTIAPWYSYREQITEIRMENGITRIGTGAFSNLANLSVVSIPDSVVTIGDRAFNMCGSLASVTLPGNMTGIGNYAFSDCGSLTGITIPAGVTGIGKWAFAGCGSLTGIRVESGNAVYSSENGVLFDKDKTVLLTYPGGLTGAYTVPAGVIGIADSAFVRCTGLTEVTVPASVTNIERSAFLGSENLTGIHVDPGSTSYSSEDGVLLNKGGTLLMICPAGKTGEYTIPAGVESIGESAFASCRKLTAVTIPEGVTSIGFGAFDSCKSLASVTIPASVTAIPGYAFCMCSLTNVIIPDSVTEIGELAFYLCDKLESITIPNSVTAIGEHAFEACTSLADVYYSGTESQWNAIVLGIGNECLTNAEIHFHTEHILTKHEQVDPTCMTAGTEEYWSCELCGALFEDPAGGQEIDAPAVIPASEDGHSWGEPEYIWAADKRTVTARRVCVYNGEHMQTETAEAWWEILSPTDTAGGSAVCTAEFEEEGFEDRSVTIVIPALNTLSVLRLPSGLETIEPEAFSGLACQAVIVPEGCTDIGEHAFAGCEGLIYVRLPWTLRNGWPENAFEGCHEDLVIDFIMEKTASDQH